jgi:hypothetical protein
MTRLEISSSTSRGSCQGTTARAESDIVPNLPKREEFETVSDISAKGMISPDQSKSEDFGTVISGPEIG